MPGELIKPREGRQNTIFVERHLSLSLVISVVPVGTIVGFEFKSPPMNRWAIFFRPLGDFVAHFSTTNRLRHCRCGSLGKFRASSQLVAPIIARTVLWISYRRGVLKV